MDSLASLASLAKFIKNLSKNVWKKKILNKFYVVRVTFQLKRFIILMQKRIFSMIEKVNVTKCDYEHLNYIYTCWNFDRTSCITEWTCFEMMFILSRVACSFSIVLSSAVIQVMKNCRILFKSKIMLIIFMIKIMS